jgi:hypothetical protein
MTNGQKWVEIRVRMCVNAVSKTACKKKGVMYVIQINE